MSGTHQGKDAVLQALGAIDDSFETFRVSPDEMVEKATRSSCSPTSRLIVGSGLSRQVVALAATGGFAGGVGG